MADDETTQRMLLFEARHSENLESFREIRKEMRGVKDRLDVMESDRTQMKTDVSSIKANTEQIIDLWKAGSLARKIFTWCISIGSAIVIAYAEWNRK